MAKMVVHLLKMINIDENELERLARLLCQFTLFLRHLQEGTAIVDAGQRIGGRLCLQQSLPARKQHPPHHCGDHCQQKEHHPHCVRGAPPRSATKHNDIVGTARFDLD